MAVYDGLPTVKSRVKAHHGRSPLSADADVVYSFGRHRFLPRRKLLVWGEEPIRIGARALDLLQLLIERQGELVSKSDLIRFAWPDTFVHESNLKVNIAALRRALLKDDLPHIITVSGRGYRFVAPVRLETASVSTSNASSGHAAGSRLPGLSQPFGRDDDIAAVMSATSEGGVTTIVGPAGVGKTTLAVAVARQLARDFEREPCFVDLAAITDPQLVCAAIASALGLGVGLSDLLVGIVNALRSADRLVILDNCEHVLSAAGSVVSHVRQEAPNVQIIATSREPIRVRSEIVYRLSPLSSPAPEMPVSVAQAMKFPAVALFVTRAQQATGYTLSESDAPIVADICRKLDGIPLAIELAAPRLQTHDATTLLQQLSRSISLLNHGPRTAPLRHQALQTTLDWSYRLLSDAEAQLLRLLSVFAGAFSADDASALAGAYGSASSESAACLARLTTKSLISLIPVEDGPQYRLLDATRSYARDKLSADGEYRRACEAHARYLQRLFALAEVDWATLPREELLTKYSLRIHDLRKAIDWAFSTDGEVEIGIALTVAAIPLWEQLSSVGESNQRVRTALEASKDNPPCNPVFQMKLATAHARNLAFAERLHPDAEAACHESVRLSQLNSNADYELRSLWGLAVLQSFAGRNRDAVASLDRLDAVAQRTQDHWAQPASARFRIMTEFYRGEINAAHTALQELALRYDRPDRGPQPSRFQIDPYVATRTSLAFVSWLRGDTTEAVQTAALALDCAQETGHLVSESNVLALAAIPVALFTGRLDEAERHVLRFIDTLNQKGLTSWRPLGELFGAVIRHRRGDPDAIDAMQIAVDGIFSGGFLLRAPLYLGMLADAALERGRVELARVSIERAIAQAERQGEAWCRPELLRVLGRVERSLGQVSEAENTLTCAAALAGESGALSFQLRAACDLAVLWNAAGRHRATVALLDPICRRFARDIADIDVMRARSLLARKTDDESGQVRRLASRS
jgi:predicted ATPase/DNA-binding winged helix-turn-helix (wHTH) protein